MTKSNNPSFINIEYRCTMIRSPKQNLFKLTAIATAISLLTACGGSDAIDEAIEDTKTTLEETADEVKDKVDEVITGETTLEGTFVDSAVAGINYECGDNSGVTDIDGKFDYNLGDSCTFKIGDFSIGSIDNMTVEAPVVTPFDVAVDDEQAIKIASILQTIDADGDPSNGIDITSFVSDHDTSKFTADLLTAEEDAFYAAVLDITGIPAVTLEAAQQHIVESIGVAKGYHSSAIEAVIAKIQTIDDRNLEQLDVEAFLADIHTILDTADDSDGNDAAVLEAIISIFEIINNPIVKERVQIDVDGGSGYTNLLPQIIDASINASESMLKTGTGSTVDVSNLFFDMATRLAAVSNTLGKSFTDPSYVAVYGEDEDGDSVMSIDADTAYGIQATALAYSSILSYFSAYNYGSDAYYIPQTFTGKVDVINVTYPQGEADYVYTASTIDADTDYINADIHPDELYNDPNFGSLHADEKYLTLAKTSLISLLELGKKENTVENNDGEAARQQKNQSIIDSALANLSAADGTKSFVDLALFDDSDDTAGKLNLQAMYSTTTALSRKDFDISASLNCGDYTYSETYSKLDDYPMCSLGDYDGGEVSWEDTTFLYDSPTGYTAIYAFEADFELDIEPKSNAVFERFLPECTYTDGEETDVKCLED